MMKKVDFRWIDKYLLHVKIQENFLILFFAPLLAIIIVSMTLMGAANSYQNELLEQDKATVSALIAGSNYSKQELEGILTTSNFQLSEARSPEINHLSLEIKAQPHLLSELTPVQGGLIVMSLVFIAMCLYYIMTFMGGALYEIYRALTRLEEGDLTARIGYAPARNDFNLIAQIIDRVCEREHKLVLATQEAIELIQDIGSKLQQRSNDNEQLTEQQKERIDSLVSATQQMVHSIREVASHAHDTSEQTQEASQISNDGLELVNSTLNTINQLSTEINSAAGAVSELDANAIKINEMVSTINGISEQTNLLALNAAIEAARAGEQGRGFAVVADEVRTLASRTQGATVEIQQLIESLQENSQHLLGVTQKTVNNAESSEEMMEAVSQNINSIFAKNQFIADRSTEIAAAAEEQGAVSDSIAGDVEQVRMQSQQVATMLTESAAETQQLTKQTRALKELMEGLTV